VEFDSAPTSFQHQFPGVNSVYQQKLLCLLLIDIIDVQGLQRVARLGNEREKATNWESWRGRDRNV